MSDAASLQYNMPYNRNKMFGGKPLQTSCLGHF